MVAAPHLRVVVEGRDRISIHDQLDAFGGIGIGIGIGAVVVDVHLVGLGFEVCMARSYGSVHELEHQPGLTCGHSSNVDGEASGIVLDEGRDAVGLGFHHQVVVVAELQDIAVVVQELDVDMVGGLPLVDLEGGVVAAPHLRVVVEGRDRISIHDQLDAFGGIGIGIGIGAVVVDVHLVGLGFEVCMARSYGSVHELEHQPGLTCGHSSNVDGEASGIVLDEGRDAVGLGFHHQVVVVAELQDIAVVVQELDVDMVGGLPLVDLEGGVVAAPHLRVGVVGRDRLFTYG